MRAELADDIAVRARFGTTVCALVKAGLGIAVIDQSTVAAIPASNAEDGRADPVQDRLLAVKRGAPLSLHIELSSNLALGNAGGGPGKAALAEAQFQARGNNAAEEHDELIYRLKWVMASGSAKRYRLAGSGRIRTEPHRALGPIE